MTKTCLRNRGLSGIGLIAFVVCCAASAQAGVAPEQKCEAGKNDAAGKYAQCLAKAEKKLVSTGDQDKYGAALAKCSEKCATSWGKLEDAATAKETVCPSMGDQVPIQDFLDACQQSVAEALAGGVLGPDPVTCASDLGTCTTDLSVASAELGTCNGNLSSCTDSVSTCNGGTAVQGDVLEGKTFSSSAGLGATGTMPDNGAVTLTPTTSDQAIAAGYHNGSGKCAGDADLVAGNIRAGVDLFGVTGTASSGGGLAQTGQTTCYDATGTTIPCAGTGQDGEFQKGSARAFTDNGDGTVTDQLTGLMWEKLSDDGSIHDKDDVYTWATAFSSKIANLNSVSFAGYTDWRVPNPLELYSLVNFGAYNPSTFSSFNAGCAAGCTVLTCSCTRAYDYWASASDYHSPSLAWYVAFLAGGTLSNHSKGATKHVRAVRAGY